MEETEDDLRVYAKYKQPVLLTNQEPHWSPEDKRSIVRQDTDLFLCVHVPLLLVLLSSNVAVDVCSKVHMSVWLMFQLMHVSIAVQD